MTPKEMIAKIVWKFLWDAQGWIIVVMAFIAIGGWMLEYMAKSTTKAPIAALMNIVGNFIALGLTITVVIGVFTKVIKFLVGWW